MTFLKYLMLFMIALLIVVLVIVGYFFYTAKVTVAGCEINGVQASAQPELFGQVIGYAGLDALQGTMFTDTPIGDSADYAFITYTLQLSNQCLVPVEMIEVQVIPQEGDILQIGDFSNHSLQAKNGGSISATILTMKNTHPVRELLITYYVWGVSFSIRYTCG